MNRRWKLHKWVLTDEGNDYYSLTCNGHTMYDFDVNTDCMGTTTAMYQGCNVATIYALNN